MPYTIHKNAGDGPDYVPALLDLGNRLHEARRLPQCNRSIEKARTVDRDSVLVLSDLAQAYALSGDKAEANRILHQLRQNSISSFVSPWDLSLVYIALGDKGRAIALLKKAAGEHVGWVVRLQIDPAFDSLRTEPEFRELVQRIRIRDPESVHDRGRQRGSGIAGSESSAQVP